MKFSIVTISFNQAEFLERTILSVISQTGVDLEYIVVDPGSTDGSRSIIERYRDEITHVIFEKDNGPADGLNKGFARATGDVYCYLNADDTLEAEAFAKVAKYFKEHKEIDVVCGHAWVTDRNDKRLRRVWSERFTRWRVAYGASVQIQPSTFIRRSAFALTKGFNPNNRVSWDGELMVELFLAGAHIRVIPEFLSTYRLHGESITNSGRLATTAATEQRIRFKRLMGRNWQVGDGIIEMGMRLHKHLFAPRATLERFIKGPIFNRGVK